MADETDKTSQTIKMVIVGEGAVGKTCLLHSYLDGVLPSIYEPTVYENHVGCYSDGKNDNHISFWDTAGQEQFDNLRPLSYQDTTVFIVCFSVDERKSFDNIPTKWLPEVRKYCGLDVPTVLVGTKIDIRREAGNVQKQREKGTKTFVTHDEGLVLAKAQKMFGYVECSAKLTVGCDNVIKMAVEAARKYEMPVDKNNSCCIVS